MKINFLSHYLKQRRKDVAKDLLVVLVLVKFSLGNMIGPDWVSITLSVAILIGGVIAIAVRLSIFGNLLSIAAIVIFLLDIYLQGGPDSVVLFGFLSIIAILLYIFMRFFSR